MQQTREWLMYIRRSYKAEVRTSRRP